MPSLYLSAVNKIPPEIIFGLGGGRSPGLLFRERTVRPESAGKAVHQSFFFRYYYLTSNLTDSAIDAFNV